MNLNGQQYIALNTLEECKSYASKKMVCENIVIYDTANRPCCEIDILRGITTTMPATCTPTTFPANTNLFQSLGNNNWLFILNDLTSSLRQRSQVTIPMRTITTMSTSHTSEKESETNSSNSAQVGEDSESAKNFQRVSIHRQSLF
ncbi:hypothetical protein EVAR_51164_1 [Eumeta japonica]|uniref:Uncharacterized protein n=1 Tax=Eumeta variegata TaxID=151549 RepID=A0A4C1XDI1_EUMVA|nr:hypothetical protein EVAR_51164_1 [Eumeta japonica]